MSFSGFACFVIVLIARPAAPRFGMLVLAIAALVFFMKSRRFCSAIFLVLWA